MKGKEKCRILKEIRRQIAEENDIPYAVSQCTHKGDCKGTCPKCESELRYLERELAIRQGLGKVVAIAGISVGTCAALTACSPQALLGGGQYMEETDEEIPVEAGVLPMEEETEPDETLESDEPTADDDIAGDIAIEDE